jgi:divinyl protochlorophyllide a 8-vinyl-reductase
LIGPNAILQYLPVLDQLGGPGRRSELLVRAGLLEMPDGSGMIPEEEAHRLHRQVRLDEPGMAPMLAWRAGRGTADYILAHRIPRGAQRVLRALPPPLSARALSRAIARHAWTFIGSGRFRVASPWAFEIAGNPLIRGEHATERLCDWHAGVFARLYDALVEPGCTCVETRCAAVDPGGVCRFELRRPER